MRNLRDPALLEYIGEGAIQASVFPIPPGEDRRIEIEYGEIIPAEEGLSHYRYPLNTERFSAAPLEAGQRCGSRSIPATPYAPSTPHRTMSPSTVRTIFTSPPATKRTTSARTPISSSSGVFRRRPSVPASSVTVDELGEGYFLLLAAPGIAEETEIVAKDVILVLDTSGSMEGEKIEQAREALLYVLDHLNPEDRFNIVEFSTGAREYARELVPASEAEDAARWVRAVQATGGTDINLALLNALDMVESERPTMVLFLTDGLPTEGEIETAAFLRMWPMPRPTMCGSSPLASATTSMPSCSTRSPASIRGARPTSGLARP